MNDIKIEKKIIRKSEPLKALFLVGVVIFFMASLVTVYEGSAISVGGWPALSMAGIVCLVGYNIVVMIGKVGKLSRERDFEMIIKTYKTKPESITEIEYKELEEGK